MPNVVCFDFLVLCWCMLRERINDHKVRELAERVRQSENHFAFQMLFDVFWEPMYGYAASIVQDKAVAQDLVQEVWLDYWKRRKEIEVDNLKGYLYKAVRYKCYNHLRNAKFNRVHLEVAETIASEDAIGAHQAVLDLTAEINSILLTLPSRCQEIFRLSRINEYSNSDIAEMLNISQRTVENQISTVLRRLRRELSIVRLFTVFLGF